jgi:hypothetical protein
MTFYIGGGRGVYILRTDVFTPNAGAHPDIRRHWFAAVSFYVPLASYFQSPNLHLALDLSRPEAE